MLASDHPAIGQIHPNVQEFFGHAPGHADHHPGHDAFHIDNYLHKRHMPVQLQLPAKPPSSAVITRLPIVVVGAGPFGLLFLLKYLEGIHDRMHHEQIDVRILLLEERANLVYPDGDHYKNILVDRDTHGPETVVLWDQVSDWPICVKENRFQDKTNHTGSLQECIHVGMHYSVLRYDLLLLVSQICHALFGDHKHFHFVPNVQLPTVSLENFHADVESHMSPEMQLCTKMFRKSGRHLSIVCTSGWRTGGLGSLLPGNKWHIKDPKVSYKLSLSGKVVGRMKPATDDEAVERQLLSWAFYSSGLPTPVFVPSTPDPKKIDLTGRDDSDNQELLKYWQSKDFGHLSDQAISFQLFCTHAPTAARDIIQGLRKMALTYPISNLKAPEVLHLQGDVQNGIWQTFDFQTLDSHYFLVGSAAANLRGAFVYHTSSACVLAKILSYARPNLAATLPAWTDYVRLGYSHVTAPGNSALRAYQAGSAEFMKRFQEMYFRTSDIPREIKCDPTHLNQDFLLHMDDQTAIRTQRQEFQHLKDALNQVVHEIHGDASRWPWLVESSMCRIPNMAKILLETGGFSQKDITDFQNQYNHDEREAAATKQAKDSERVQLWNAERHTARKRINVALGLPPY